MKRKGPNVSSLPLRSLTYNTTMIQEDPYRQLPSKNQPLLNPTTTMEPSAPSVNLDEEALVNIIDNDTPEPTTNNMTHRQSLQSYLHTITLPIELVVCMLSPVLALFLPKLILSSTYERPIPYQITNQGDVILDPSINNPYNNDPEIVSNVQLLITCLIVPSILFLLLHYPNLKKIHTSICPLFFALGLTVVLTDLLKSYVGYFRPNFYNYCQFDKDTLQCENDNQGELEDARRSFPSGHASVSFTSMMVVMLVLWQKLHTSTHTQRLGDYSHRIEHTIRLKKLAAICIPLVYALFVAGSRARQDRHHPADIVGGSMLGVGIGWLAWSLWYPARDTRVMVA